MSGINEKAMLITGGIVVIGFVWYAMTQQTDDIDRERQDQLTYDQQMEVDALAERFSRWGYVGEGGLAEFEDPDIGGGVPMNIAEDDDQLEEENSKFEEYRKDYENATNDYASDIKNNIIDWYRYKAGGGMNFFNLRKYNPDKYNTLDIFMTNLERLISRINQERSQGSGRFGESYSNWISDLEGMHQEIDKFMDELRSNENHDTLGNANLETQHITHNYNQGTYILNSDNRQYDNRQSQVTQNIENKQDNFLEVYHDGSYNDMNTDTVESTKAMDHDYKDDSFQIIEPNPEEILHGQQSYENIPR